MACVDPGKECNNFSLEKNQKFWDFPGGPVARTLRSQRRGPRFNPWSGS